jgi:hypothetical protein
MSAQREESRGHPLKPRAMSAQREESRGHPLKPRAMSAEGTAR